MQTSGDDRSQVSSDVAVHLRRSTEHESIEPQLLLLLLLIKESFCDDRDRVRPTKITSALSFR